MPYVSQTDRVLIDRMLNANACICNQNPGRLNYLITRAIELYLQQWPKPSYQLYNEVVGVLECAKLEFYRRKIAPYENDKLAEHGDVY